MAEKNNDKITGMVVDQLIPNKKPKPNVDVSLCHRCNRMTDQWNEVLGYWLCKTCLKEQCDENKHALEDILEHMCDGT